MPDDAAMFLLGLLIVVLTGGAKVWMIYNCPSHPYYRVPMPRGFPRSEDGCDG